MADNVVQLQRLDQQFPWDDDPLQSELRRLMSTLEPRFLNLENQIVDWEAAVENITGVGLARVNEVLGPLLEQLTEAAQIGFLVAYATEFENTLVQDDPFGILINSEGFELWSPTPWIDIQDMDDPDNWAIAQLQSFDKVTGDLTITPRFVNKPATAGENWAVSASSGILPATASAAQAALDAQAAAEAALATVEGSIEDLQDLIDAVAAGPVASVAGKTGAVTLVEADIANLVSDLAAKASTSYVNSQVAAKQAASAKLDALSALTWAVNTIPAFTGSATISAYAISAFTRDTLFSQTDAAAWRTALSITSPTPASAAEIRSGTSNNPIVASAIVTSSAVVTLTDATTVAVDWNTFINAQVTVTANRAIGNPTNGQPGTSRTIMLKGSSGTARTVTFGNQFKGDVPSITDVTSTKWYLLTIFCVDATHFVVSSKRALG